MGLRDSREFGRHYGYQVQTLETIPTAESIA